MTTAPATASGLVEVADGVFAYLTSINNAAAVVTSDAIVVIDSLVDYDEGRAFLAALRERSAAPIRHLVLTHHHGDHVGGHRAFTEQGATVIAQHRFVALAARRSRRMRRFYEGRAFPARDFEQARADLTFRDQLTLHLGDTRIELRHLGRTETDDAIVAFLPHQRVLCIGDSITTAMTEDGRSSFPIFGQPGAQEGLDETGEWIEVLEELLTWDFDTVICGHGPLSSREAIRMTIELQRWLLDEVGALMDDAVPVPRIVEHVRANIPARYAALPGVWGTIDFAAYRCVKAMSGWMELRPDPVTACGAPELEAARKAADGRPGDADAQVRLAEALLEQGLRSKSAFDRGDFEQAAEDALARAEALEPSCAAASLVRAEMVLRRHLGRPGGKPLVAVPALTAAIDLGLDARREARARAALAEASALTAGAT